MTEPRGIWRIVNINLMGAFCLPILIIIYMMCRCAIQESPVWLSPISWALFCSKISSNQNINQKLWPIFLLLSSCRKPFKHRKAQNSLSYVSFFWQVLFSHFSAPFKNCIILITGLIYDSWDCFLLLKSHLLVCEVTALEESAWMQLPMHCYSVSAAREKITT